MCLCVGVCVCMSVFVCLYVYVTIITEKEAMNLKRGHDRG